MTHGHHPPHVYLDDTWYIITASTLNHAPFLTSDRAKVLVRDKLKSLIVAFNVRLLAWAILNNHYHLLLNWSLANFQNAHILGQATIKALDMGVRSSGFSRF